MRRRDVLVGALGLGAGVSLASLPSLSPLAWAGGHPDLKDRYCKHCQKEAVLRGWRNGDRKVREPGIVQAEEGRAGRQLAVVPREWTRASQQCPCSPRQRPRRRTPARL